MSDGISNFQHQSWIQHEAKRSMKKQNKIKQAVLAAASIAVFSTIAIVVPVAFLFALGIILAGIVVIALGCAVVSKLQGQK